MVYIGSKDILEVYSSSVISNVDYDVISRLYQPLIGYKAAMLYFTLVNYANNNEGEVLTHEHIFKIMQIAPSDFLVARKALEACGLIKSYLKIADDVKRYKYVVYAPISPKEFFNDTLFKGLLVRYIGEKETIKLALHYKTNINTDDMKDISTSFVDVFHPDLDDSSFDVSIPALLKDHAALKIKSDFSLEKFFAHIASAAMINENAFSKKECDEIERIAGLYNLDVLAMADIIMENFDERAHKGSRINFAAVKERAINEAKYALVNKKVNEGKTFVRISGKTKLADEISLMEEMAPRLYLESKQDGAPLVTADLRLLNYLSEVLGLSNATINALLYYCLKNCDNKLSRNYVEKVASTLKREKITTASDALNYFERSTKDKKSKSVAAEKSDKKEDTKKVDEAYDEKEHQKLVDAIFGDNK